MGNDRLKFRVHIIKTGERLPVCDLSWRDGLFFTATRIVDKNHAEIVSGCIKAGVVELEQCTGLSASKSYRGEKPEDLLIWEGDILGGFAYYNSGLIVWQNAGFGFMHKAKTPLQKELSNGKDWYDFCSFAGHHYLSEILGRFEIIGTVHEEEV